MVGSLSATKYINVRETCSSTFDHFRVLYRNVPTIWVCKCNLATLIPDFRIRIRPSPGVLSVPDPYLDKKKSNPDPYTDFKIRVASGSGLSSKRDHKLSFLSWKQYIKIAFLLFIKSVFIFKKHDLFDLNFCLENNFSYHGT